VPPVSPGNAVTGTPLYLSPEAVNEPDRLDARADVYAFGAVAYYPNRQSGVHGLDGD
jgi:serine/threonine protein kinase